MAYVQKRIGDRRTFAIEFEFDPHQNVSEREIWGCVWLWAGGHCIGETWEIEIVEFGLRALQEAANDPGSRARSLLSSAPLSEALDLVMWARYGDDDPNMDRLVGSRESLEPFEILPRRTGAFFDNWQAILIEEEGAERMVFRRRGQSTCDVVWPIGTFKRTVWHALESFIGLSTK